MFTVYCTVYTIHRELLATGVGTPAQLHLLHLLAHLTQHRVTFKDQEDVRRTDNFDVSLVLSYDSFGQRLGQQANKLRLKYFIIMTGFKASITKCKFIGHSQYNSL